MEANTGRLWLRKVQGRVVRIWKMSRFAAVFHNRRQLKENSGQGEYIIQMYRSGTVLNIQPSRMAEKVGYADVERTGSIYNNNSGFS